MVQHEGRSALLDEFLGEPGFTLLTDGISRQELDTDTLQLLDRWAVRVVCLVQTAAQDGRASYVDLDGGYLPGLRQRGQKAVLIRPDFYVFGAATEPDGIRAVLESLDAQLRPSPVPSGVA